MEQIDYKLLPVYYCNKDNKFLSEYPTKHFIDFDLVPVRYLVNNLVSPTPIPVKYPEIYLEYEKLVLYYTDFITIFKDNKDLLLFRMKYGI